MFIASVVYQETKPHSIAKPYDQKYYFVVHTDDGTARTVQYHGEEGKPGQVKIVDGATKSLEMVKAYEFDVHPDVGYPWKEFEKWVINHSGYHNTIPTQSHNQYTFVDVCVARITSKCMRPVTIERAAFEIPLSVHTATPAEKALFEKFKHDVEHKVHLIQQRDLVHNTLVGADAQITSFVVEEAAEHKVQYGTIHFAKINIGKVYLHVRCHQFHNREAEFHSIDTTRYSCVWKKHDPLVYFDY